MLLLLAKGFRPIARRYKTPLGEIDLIVKRGRTIAFVEVKARASRDDALESVGRAVGAAHRRRRRPLARQTSGRRRPRPPLRHGGGDAVAAAAASRPTRFVRASTKVCVIASGVCARRADPANAIVGQANADAT